MKRLLKNTGTLLMGNAGASVLNLVSLALTARALGPALFGNLALIKAYVFLVEIILTFQSWQALIKYGTEALERRQPEAFRRLIKFGTLLDAGSAAAGALLAAGGIAAFGAWRHWPPELISIGTIYCAALLFNLTGTPKAVLRLYDRFNLFAVQQVAAAAIKVVGVVAVYAAHGGFAAFMVAWMVSEIAGYLILLGLGWRTLVAHGVPVGPTLAAPLHGLRRQFAGLWGFVWTTNLNTTLKMGIKEVDMLIVGGLLGTAAAGIYKVARQCAKIAYEFTGPLQEALYPELAKCSANGRTADLRRLMWRAGLLGGAVTCAIWLGFLLLGRPMLRLAFGAPFVEAYAVLAWYLFALTIASTSLPLSPTALSLGRPHLVFWANLVSAVVYLSLLGVCLRALGLAGAGAAYVLYYATWTSILGAGVWSLLAKPATLRPVAVKAMVPAVEAPE